MKPVKLNPFQIARRDSKIRETRIEYEKLRQWYIQDFTFKIDLLSQAEKMNEVSEELRGTSFLKWDEEHSRSLEIMRRLLTYLLDNPILWDYKYVNAVIEVLPKNEDSKPITEDPFGDIDFNKYKSGI